MITILSEAYDLMDKFKDFPTALLIPYTNIHSMYKFRPKPMGVLTSGSTHTRPSDQPSIDMSANCSAHMPAKLPTSPKTPQK